MKRAATPTATAARASTGTNSRSPPVDVALAAGLLDRMGRVENHGRAGLTARIGSARMSVTRVFSRNCAAFGEQDVDAPDLLELGDHVLHVPGGQKLPLLDVDRLPVLAAATSRSV